MEAGEVEKIARGLYALPGHLLGKHQSLLEVSKQVPAGVICLLSALSFHDIGTQLPHEVWLAIGNKAHPPVIPQVAIHVVRFSAPALAFGVEKHELQGVELRVTSSAKTVADCFKYRNRIGIDVAIEALREGWRDRCFTPAELREAARVCRVENVMQPYLEAIL